MNLKARYKELMLLASLNCKIFSKKCWAKKAGCFISMLLLCGCALNHDKNKQINPQQLISEQDVLEIADIAIAQLELLLDTKLEHRPEVHFVNAQQLKAHLLSHFVDVDQDSANALSHYSQSVVAIYCEYEKDIYVVADNIQIYERSGYSEQEVAYDAMLHILIHELVHAIQDQRGLLNWPAANAEQFRAFSTLVEGHADLQTALVLKRIGLIDDIYDYGVHPIPIDSDDKALNQFSDEFSQRYVIGKKIFNKIHQRYGNDATWLALKAPRQQIQRMLNP